MELKELFSKINDLLNKKSNIIIAIDGMSGSGKSTLAKKIAEVYGASIIHMDDFFLPLEKRTEDRLNEAGGNFDRERFIIEVLDNLASDFSYGKFNCKKMLVDTEVFIKKSSVTIVEGSYSLHPDLIGKYDLKICTKTSAENQIERIKKREPEFLVEKFKNIWIPMENKYHDFYHIYDICDIIIEN